MITKNNINRAFVVYCHTNKTNNKKYIGITCQEPEVRWGHNGNQYKQSQPYFARAIAKYGWDGFSHEILFENLTADEANNKEIELIALHHTFVGDPECLGYNLTRGGFGGLIYQTEDERRAAVNKSSRESKKKNRELQKQQNPEVYELYLQKERIRSKKRMQDPVQYRKMLDKNNRNVAKYKQDPIKKSKIDGAKRQVYKDIKQIRDNLKDLYRQHPEAFTEDQRHLVFDFSANGKSYICTSKKHLQQIQQQVNNQQEVLCQK